MGSMEPRSTAFVLVSFCTPRMDIRPVCSEKVLWLCRYQGNILRRETRGKWSFGFE